MTDPFRPIAARFPRDRLLRAGLDEQAVNNLAERFDDQSPGARRKLVDYVNRHTDHAIAERYGAGDLDRDGEPDTPTREHLDELTVPLLRDRLAARRLPVSGNKGELVDRLLDSYEPGTPVAGTVGERPDDADPGQQAHDDTSGLPPAAGSTREPAPEQPPSTPVPEPPSAPQAPPPAPAQPGAPAPAPQPAQPPQAPPTPGTTDPTPVEQPAAPATPSPAPTTPAGDTTSGPTPGGTE